jgi:hypothetical protein
MTNSICPITAPPLDIGQNSVPIARSQTLKPEELIGKIVIGEFLDIEKPELTQTVAAVRAKAMASGGGN